MIMKLSTVSSESMKYNYLLLILFFLYSLLFYYTLANHINVRMELYHLFDWWWCNQNIYLWWCNQNFYLLLIFIKINLNISISISFLSTFLLKYMSFLSIFLFACFYHTLFISFSYYNQLINQFNLFFSSTLSVISFGIKPIQLIIIKNYQTYSSYIFIYPSVLTRTLSIVYSPSPLHNVV